MFLSPFFSFPLPLFFVPSLFPFLSQSLPPPIIPTLPLSLSPCPSPSLPLNLSINMSLGFGCRFLGEGSLKSFTDNLSWVIWAVTCCWVRSGYLTEAWPNMLSQVWGGDHQGDEADLLTRWFGNLGATGWPSPPCNCTEKLKSPFDFIFYVASLLFPIFMEMLYEERMATGIFSFFSSGSSFHLSSPCLVSRRLIPILWFCVIPLPSGFWVGLVIIKYHEDMKTQAVGVLIPLPPSSEATNLQWLPFCSKVTGLRGRFSPSAIAADLTLFQ